MKILISLSLLLFVNVVFSQESKVTHPDYSPESIALAKEKGEAIVFQAKRIPLGSVNKGEFKEMTFRFLNVLSEPIEYSFFDVCSCSQLTYDEDAIIKPGEEGSFHIRFDSGAREDEEPVEVSFELKNMDTRVNLPYFYTVDYTFSFK